MKKSRKILSLLLCLVMLVSLLSGALAVQAAGEAFTRATALEAGREYLIVTEYEGKYYALTLPEGSGNGTALGMTEVTVADDAVSEAPDIAVWLPDGSDHLESKANPGMYVFSGSSEGAMGFCGWEGPGTYFRTAVYDAATETIALHTKYVLTFDGTQFYRSTDTAEACKVLLFARGATEAAPAPAAEPAEPAGEVVYPAPETVRRPAVKNADGSITLAFTSDTHYDGVHMNLQTWLEAANLDYIDAMGFCGDIGSAGASSPAAYWGFVGDIMGYMDGLIAEGKVGDAVYTHGNHEWASYAGGYYGREYANYESAQRVRQVGEALVTDDYIIYCFGSDYTAVDYLFDYNEKDIATLAAYLETAPTDIPIIILTHYPLHQWFGKRLGVDRYMAHAAELIDVLNTHDNLTVLWGHNHNDFDDNYYYPLFPGDEILIDPQGTMKEINFTYMAAGCTADTEYSGPDAGSATVMNKGLIITINADKTLDYHYCTIDGQLMNVRSPWLVRYRTGVGDYEYYASEYVEDGQAPKGVEAPEVEGYTFSGWVTWVNNAEEPFDFTAPVTHNILVTAKYEKVSRPVVVPDASECVFVTPDATCGGSSLTMTAAGVGDQITVFDLSSIGYGTAIMYGFWFEPDGVVSFNQDVTLYFQGAATNTTLKAGQFYSTEGFGEHYIQLDDGNDLLLLEYEAPGNYAGYPGDQPFSAFPGAVAAGAAEEPAPAPAEPEPAPAPAEPEPAPAGQTYTVKAGDTLWRIAKMFYGTGFRWDVIYGANAGIIKNPNLIYVGQVLQIP